MSPANRSINHVLRILFKQVVLDKPFLEQGIVGDCNIKVLLRLRGGGGGKEDAVEGEQSENAPKTNEAELQGTPNSSTCGIMTFHKKSSIRIC